AQLEGDSLRVVLAERRQAALKADELSALRLAVLVEPVGIHEPGRIVVGVRTDVVQERPVLPYRFLLPHPSPHAMTCLPNRTRESADRGPYSLLPRASSAGSLDGSANSLNTSCWNTIWLYRTSSMRRPASPDDRASARVPSTPARVPARSR